MVKLLSRRRKTFSLLGSIVREVYLHCSSNLLTVLLSCLALQFLFSSPHATSTRDTSASNTNHQSGHRQEHHFCFRASLFERLARSVALLICICSYVQCFWRCIVSFLFYTSFERTRASRNMILNRLPRVT